MMQRAYNRLLSLFSLSGILFPTAAWAAKFDNPLGSTTVVGLLQNMIAYALGLVGFLAMGALIWGGVLYILSAGDESRMQQGKRIVLWAIAGLVIIMLAYVIIATIAGFLGTPTS